MNKDEMKSDESDVRFDDDYYWGKCPICGKNDGCRSIGRSHWYYCIEHK